MYGGARQHHQLESPQQTDMFLLGDIGDYKDIGDAVALGVAALVGIDASILLSRTAGVGGYSMNAYFDTFGLEGITLQASLILIILQGARWFYSTMYAAGNKPWSPFVFVCVVLAVQVVHDLSFYHGVLTTVPAGKNELIDALKRYAAENGSRAITGHSACLIGVCVLAMWLKESSALFTFIIFIGSLYALPFLLSTYGPRPPPPPPPSPKKDPFEQRLTGPRI